MRNHEPHPVRRTAVVTGAAQGIGAATVHRLAALGHDVALLDVDPRGEDVAAAVRESGVRAIFVPCDVSAVDDWSGAIERVHRELGPVDALVSNALVTEPAPIHETTLASWERQLAVNLTGSFHAVRACLPDLLRPDAEASAVVLVSSVHAAFGLPGVPAYATSKAGLTGLTRQLAAEYGGRVRVNCVLPGPILTAQWDRLTDDDRDQAGAETAIGRMGLPAEVADVIAFLLGPQAGYVTGVSLPVDGGWSITKNSS